MGATRRPWINAAGDATINTITRGNYDKELYFRGSRQEIQVTG